MTEQTVRAVPTPRDMASGTGRSPLTAAAAAVGHAPAFDRYRWEKALLASDLPHYAARLLGWGLAHLAGPAGYFPPGTARVERLAASSRLTSKQVRMSLAQLEEAGLISRPDTRTWKAQGVARPVTLTLPDFMLPATEDGARRTEPDHPSPAAS